MSSICLIIIAMKLPKFLWVEILKTVAYLKNYNPSQKELILYRRANKEKLDLKYLCIVGSQTWINISISRERN